ncbi:PAS domain S-box-containing protein [Rhodoblastus acidophilus]|uniref:PAS domain-containing protein n=1 Tax=Rhodoblastus acidophilus TaxID=1074 RepID=UPI00222479D2|nr:PAS domain-containing protein [Rhodoblastus acidophilus]MCW2284067.1 PAS domain S-box-containing protein [Rhodoblastus acidophilus]MCW2332763.1 PAS domain S-box-containing protein [Rhodoblastus acidophilus]
MTPQDSGFDSFFDGAPMGAAILLKTSGVSAANGALLRMLGYQRDEFLGKTLADIIHPDDVFEDWSGLFVAGAPPLRRELRCLTKNRETLWVNLTAWALSGGQGRAMLVLEDVRDRKQGEVDLGTTIARLNEAQRAAGVGCWAADLRAGVACWSDEVFRIFGRDPALGAPADYRECRDSFAPDDWATIEAAIERLVQTGVPYEIDAELRRPGGGACWVTLRGERDVDAAGVCVMIRGTVQDITRRKQAERALRESRELLRLFIEHAPVALAMLDKDMRFVAANRPWLDAHGLRGQELVGRGLYEVMPDIPERWRVVNARCLAGEAIKADQDRFDRADGSVLLLRWEVRPWRDASDEIGGLIIFMEDLTERTRAEERFRQSEERLRTILDGVDACIYLKDREGRYLFANAALRRLWTAKLGQIVGSTDEKFLDAETVARVRAVDRRVLEDGESLRQLEPVRMRGSDETVTYLSFKLPLRGRDGAIYGLCGISTDLTERVRAEERLAESERKYRSLFENMNSALVVLEVVEGEEGRTADLVFVACNKHVERMIDRPASELVGRRVTEILPGVENDAVDWIGILGAVALDGAPVQFEGYSDVLGAHFLVAAHQSAPRQCAVNVQDISKRVQNEAEIRRLNADLERRVAERTAEVQAKERFLRMITDAAPGLLGYWDADLRNRFANRRYLEWFGVTPDWVEGRKISEVLGPELNEAVAPYVRAVLKGEPQVFERSIPRLDGGEVCVLTHYVPDIVEGEVRGFIVEISDISGFKQAQAELAEQAREFEDLYNNAPCGYHSLDRDGVIVRINDTELSWLGLTREEVVGKRRLSEFLSEKSQAIFKRTFPSVLATGRLDELEIELQTANGELLPVLVSATALRGADGAFEKTRSVMLDFSRLRQEQETFRQVMQAAPVAVRVASLADSRLLFVNRAFAELLSRSEEDALTWDIRSGYRDPAVFDEIRGRLARGEVVLNRLVEFYRPDEPERPSVWALASFMTIPYEGQMASLAWLYDVTALHDARLAAERAMAARSQFLANMSHEIRTPMNAILGFTRLLENDNPTPAQASRLAKIDVAAQHLLVLIDDILDLARIEAGGLKLEERDFDLGRLFADVAALIDSGAREKGLRLNIDMDSLPPRLSGDVTRLRQALLNYANNALKFTERGFITLRAARIEDGDGAILVRFEVEDSGIGVQPEVLPRLFRMFEQADASIKRRYGGTGLGLAITRRLAEAMGGQAGANSTPGVGSAFWFTARLKKSAGAPERRAGQRDYAAQFRDRTTRILMVEDNEINREVAVELLGAVGLTAATARNGLEALEMAKAEPFDLILMDVQMPVMDGIEAAREIRKLPGWETKPIVALTANVLSEDRSACLEAGMNDFVAKPVDPGQLYATLARLLPAAGLDGAAPVASASPDVAPAPPGLDVAAGVRRLAGDVEAYKRLARRFAELHDGDVGRIRVCLDTGDFDGARLIAHTLRGAAGNIGAGDLAEAAFRLESALQRRAEAEIEGFARAVEALFVGAAAFLLSFAAPGAASGADGASDARAVKRALDDLEAALAMSDFRARAIVTASDAALRAALAESYDPLMRQIAEYRFPQALETLRRARKS